MKLFFKGFSLVELMVVIAIVAILAAVAAPTYSLYVNKAKLSSLQTILDSIKTKSVNYYQANGTWPNAAQLGYATSGDDVTSPLSISNLALGVMIRGGSTCGNIEVVLDSTKFIGASIQPNDALAMNFGYTSNNILETVCNCERGTWGACVDGALVQFACGKNLTNQTITCSY